MPFLLSPCNTDVYIFVYVYTYTQSGWHVHPWTRARQDLTSRFESHLQTIFILVGATDRYCSYVDTQLDMHWRIVHTPPSLDLFPLRDITDPAFSFYTHYGMDSTVARHRLLVCSSTDDHIIITISAANQSSCYHTVASPTASMAMTSRMVTIQVKGDLG